MLAVHEMLKNANHVSRAEKALILGFMAGARGKKKFTQFYLLTTVFTVLSMQLVGQCVEGMIRRSTFVRDIVNIVSCC